MRFCNTVLAVFVLLISHNCLSADTTAAKVPKVVLVQLNTEANRIAALTRDKKAALLDIVLQDRDGVYASMIADFTDHFNKCPVFYFADTNQNLVKEKKLDHIILNADGTEAKGLHLDKQDDFVIVYYGSPVMQLSRRVVKDSSAYAYDQNAFIAKGLIICNDQMQQVAKYVKFAYGDVSNKKHHDKYIYKSPEFDIEYYPFAKNFNKEFSRIMNRLN